MEFRILGPLEVRRDGRPVGIGGPRQQAVLVALLLRAGQSVAVDRIIDEVWGQTPPRDAANTLHGYVFHLRQALEPDRPRGAPARVLVSDSGGYRLAVGPEAIDAACFERLADHGRRQLSAGDPARAAETLTEALGLWRGPPLEAFADLGEVRPEVARLCERRLTAVEDAVDALLAIGDPSAALVTIDAAVVDAPWREYLWEQRMVALYRAGRQVDALAAYTEIREAMRDELGLDPGPGLQALQARILEHDPALDGAPFVVPAQAGRSTLPHQTTTFVGRTGDLERVQTALVEGRLTTLLGPGGVGKTRLAIEAVARATQGADGALVHFVDLSTVGRDADVVHAVAAAVSANAEGAESALPAIEAVLAQGPSILVLDNCEHVVAAVADLVGELLSRSVELRVVATSREALLVDGEQLIAVAPLPTPDPDRRPATEDALTFPAVELFGARARASHRDFDPAAHIDDVIRVCAALDGMPLALELAAARLRSMAIGDLAARIDDRLRILTGGPRGRVSRQRTLEAAIAWSHDLLDEPEAIAFARSSVFAGGFDLAAAQDVVAGGPVDAGDVVDLVGRLVDKSLLMLEPTTGRYRMLETIRAYAQTRITADPTESHQTRHRHALWAATRLAAHAEGLRDGGRRDTVEAVEADIANFRAACNWSLGTEPAIAIAIAAELGPWWELTGALREGRSTLEAALASHDGDELDRSRATLALGFIARRQGDHDTAVAATTTALTVLRRLDEPEHLAHALGRMAWVALGAGDHAHAVSLANEGLALADRLGDAAIAAWMHLGLGHAAHEQGDLDLAADHLGRARDGFGSSNSRAGLGRALFHLALLALERDDPEQALEAAADAAQITNDSHDINGAVMALEVAARVASVAGHHDVAIKLLTACSTLRSDLGAHDHGGISHISQIHPLAAAHLDAQQLAEAEQAGRDLDLDQAVQALSQWRDRATAVPR